MVRRALLIGSQTYGLKGCDADVSLMREALGRRGFEIDVRTAADASRAGIADGFERLIAASGPADAALVYYSGHGGRVVRPDAEARRVGGLSVHYQFLVPFDIDDSEQGDFRGLLSEELTAYQRRLTDAFIAHAAVPNVTTILDCCHSGYAARDTTLVPKFIELEPRMFRMMGIRTRAEQFSGGDGLETNADAVRLVACQEEQSAYERPSARSGYHGVLTDALVTVLDELGEDVSWAVVGDAVRRKVADVTKDQRPDVEGPSSRLLFSPDVDDRRTSFTVARRGAAAVIEAAALFGLALGDTVLLEAVLPRQRVATAVVGTIDDGDAVLDVALDHGVAALPDVVRALPQRMSGATSRVAVRVDGPTGALLRERIELAPWLATDESAGPVVATVVDDGGLVVLDSKGAPMRAPEADDERGRQRIVDVLELIAHARRLRDVRPIEGDAELTGTVAIRFASIADGVRTERPLSGERFEVGDRLALSVVNEGDEPRYFWVFDIGISGRVEMITSGAPGGTLLGPSGAPDASRELFRAGGSAVRWPPDVPRRSGGGGDELPETLLIVVADRRQDLTALTSPVADGRGTPGAQLARGDQEVVADTPFRYRVVTIDFLVRAPDSVSRRTSGRPLPLDASASPKASTGSPVVHDHGSEVRREGGTVARQKMGDVIVLLPGILGSVLERDGKEVWAPTPGAALRALWTLGRNIRGLRLESDPVEVDDLDGVVATRLMPDVHIIPGLWSIDGYSAISAMITGTFDVVPGKTFIPFPYDWRRDNRVAARRLSEVALAALHEQRKENPDAKLVLIGHSMGGLVARYFLECLGGWQDTRMLITFGTPYRGSLNAVDFIANGFAKKVGPFKVADLSTLLRSLTSVYQLLPIYPCIDVGAGTLVRVAEASGIEHLDTERARRAEQDFHRAIEHAVEQRAVADPYTIHPIVGLTQPTKQSAKVSPTGGVDIFGTYEGEDLDGDGTVPRVSATPLELDDRPDQGIYAPERHASLQNAISVHTQLRGLLQPVLERERFRDARGGLGLDVDDLYISGEEIAVSVTAETKRLSLVATVIDLDDRRPVAGPIPLTRADDDLTHVVELPPLPADVYRVEVEAIGATAGSVQPVHGVFVVADDVEPD